MYVWENVEERDYIIPMGKYDFETSNNVYMVGLMLLITIEICIIGKTVIMDRGFCVLKGILKMRKKCVYGGVMIK